MAGLSIAVLVGAALRLAHISRYDLWFDESITALTQIDPTQIFSSTLFNAPLYYSLLWVWLRLFELNELFIRLPSALAGIASIAVVYLLAKHWFDKTTGLLSALLLAVSPLHIYYAQEARHYSLVTLLYITATFLLVKKTPKIPNFFTYALLLMAVATDYYALTLLATLFICTNRNIRAKTMAATFLILLCIALAFSNFFSQCLSHVLHPFFWVQYSSPKALWTMLEIFTIGYNATPLLYKLITPCCLVLCMIAILNEEKNGKFCFLLLVIPILFFWVIGLFIHCFLLRRMIMFSPFYLILIARGIVCLKNSRLALLASFFFILILAANIVSLHFYYQNFMPRFPERLDFGTYSKPSYKEGIDLIKLNYKRDDIVAHTGLCSTVPFGFYTRQDNAYLFYLQPTEARPTCISNILNGNNQTDKKYRFVVKLMGINLSETKTFPWPRIWLVSANWNPNQQDNDLGLAIKAGLDAQYNCVRSEKLGSLWIYLMEHK